MPVEIRELLIKTTIEESRTSNDIKVARELAQNNEQFKRNILNQCKAYVDKKMKEFKER